MRSLLCFIVLLGGMAFSQAQTNSNARTGRFIRGIHPMPSYQSFVIALDGQKGVGVGAIDGGLGVLENRVPWYLQVPLPWAPGLPGIPSRLHRGVDFVEYPIVGFGSASGGSPLFSGRNYRFGTYFGARPPGVTLDYDLIIYAFAKPTGGAQQDWVDCQKIRIPVKGTAEWEAFAANGYRLKVPDSAWQTNQTPGHYGLETTVELLEAAGPAGMWGVDSPLLSPYVLTHKASGTGFYFRVEARGYIQESENAPWESMAYDWQTEEAEDEILYTLDFDSEPTWSSTFIHSPHFQGEPMPEGYAGKSSEELDGAGGLVDYQFAAPDVDWLLTDNSPELRQHPTLDKLVESLGGDPIALANFVINEIRFADGLSYDATGGVDGDSINEGGIRRSALGNYLEGQGSPREQCALLVYLLREAGIPAGFVEAPHNGMKMLDSRMSRILRMQIKGYTGQDNTQVVPHEIPVNYPWVAAYVPDEANPGQSKWVHIFPWIKDTEIKEGLNLYDYMPEDYGNGDLWSRKYLDADPAIMGLDSENDTPESLFPKFIQATLQQNHPTISLSDIGMSIRDRQNLYSRWEDFPMPWSVADQSTLQLSENYAATPEVFDTFDLKILTPLGNSTLVDLPGLRACDLHNRRLLIYFEQTGPDQHQLVVSLAPFRESASDSGDFNSPMILARQSRTADASGMPGPFPLEVIERRHRSLPNGFLDPGGSVASFLQIDHSLENSYKSIVRKGEYASLVINFGRFTQRMLDVHSNEIWKSQRALLADSLATGDPEIFRGGPMTLLAGSYFERTSRFDEILNHLHKTQQVSRSDIAIAKLLPERDAVGELPNDGEITLRFPAIDVFAKRSVIAGSGLTRPDLGAAASRDALYVSVVNSSAHEHFVIDQLFGFDDSISAVKLLHNAKAESREPVALDNWNYLAKGEEFYTVGSETKKLKDWDPGMWQDCVDAFGPVGVGDEARNAYSRVYITPGHIEGAGGDYLGMGAFIFGSNSISALIDNSLNGGFGRALASCSFDEEDFRTMRLELSFEESFRLSFNCDVNIQVISNDPDVAWWLFEELSASASEFYVTAYQDARMAAYALEMGLPYTPGDGNSFMATVEAFENKGSAGQPSFFGNLVAMVSDPVHVVTGEFHIDQVDLTLPGPMPLEIRRNYSSQNLARNEFGYGWKLGYFPQLTVASGEEILYAAEMDGSVIAYRKESPTLWRPQPSDNPTLSNYREGIPGGSGNVFGSRIDKAVDGSYTLTGADGSTRRFVVQAFPGGGLNRERPYLDKWTDSNGNFLDFEHQSDVNDPGYGKLASITSSNGSFVRFEHDVLGRIKSAFTGDGRRIDYRYDGHGDLIQVTRPDASVVGYEYGRFTESGNTFSDHLIVRELKPDGRILENDYDALRRVTEQRATVGTDMTPVRNATFVYDQSKDTDPQSPYFNALTGHTIVSDAYDRETRYDYVGGQITAITDPLNQTVSQEWYAPGDTSSGAFPRSLKQHIDKRGFVTNFFYDGAGNLDYQTSLGDVTGDGTSDSTTTHYAFNSLNQPTEIIDPGSNKVVFHYADSLRPRLATKVQRFAGATLISEDVNTYEDVVSSTRQAKGLLASTVTASGTADEAVTSWTHDPRGYPLSMTRETGTSDPDVVTTFVFNNRGEEIERKDSAGRKVVSAYDNMGRRIWEEYWQDSSRIGWNYRYFNGNGEVEWTDGPRYAPEDFVWRKYDGAGRPMEELVWRSKVNNAATGVDAGLPDNALYSSAFFQHNLFGDLTAAINPLGNAQTYTYNAIGQLTGVQRRAGGPAGSIQSTEDFTREPGGLPATHTNPLGGVTNYAYTADGKLRRQENPDNTVLEWRYQLDGRVVREPINHNNFYDIAYDDAARTITKTLKTLSGDTLATETKILDRRGNCISETDREGNTWLRTYDGLNRPKTITGPAATANAAQQSSSFSYDASGETTVVENALGETATTTTDILGRTTRLELRDASNTLNQVTAWAYSPDHHSVTVTRGEGADAIAETVFTDTTGAEILRINGENEKTIFARNQHGLLRQIIDPLGRATVIEYDFLDRPKKRTKPDGGFEFLYYDPAGNLTGRSMNNVLGWQAGYDTAGRQTYEFTFLGNNFTRYQEHTYFPSGPDAGLRNTTEDQRGVTFSHAYDDFRRLESLTASGPLPEQNQSLAWTYDNRGTPETISQTGGGQPDSTITRTITAYGQTENESVEFDGTTNSFSQTWNAAGRRSALNGNQSGGAAFQPMFQHNAAGQVTSVNVGVQSYQFQYTTAGLLKARVNPFRVQTVQARDLAGRVLNQNIVTGSTTPLSEAQTWNSDSTLDTYTANRIGTHAWDESRAFGYDANTRVLSETFAPGPGATATLNHTFSANKMGILARSRIGTGGNANWNVEVTGLSTLQRILAFSDNTGTQTVPASGEAFGAASVKLEIDGSPGPATYHPGWQDNTGAWSASLTLTPGAHNLTARAVHPSGWETDPATSSFRVTGTPQTLSQTFDGMGNVATRTWSGGKAQTLTWDAFGRLVKVTQTGVEPFVWTAAYDGLGRRLRTTHTPSGGNAFVINSSFDLEHEFLEVGVNINGVQNWRVNGPDLNGSFGALNGTGGLESVITPAEITGTITDTFGNVVASVGGNNTVTWSGTKVGGYGPLPQYAAQTLESGASLIEASAWKTRRNDPTGFINLGARHYDYARGVFISADPLGHASSWSLYDYANGDPINQFDADGRLASQYGDWMQQGGIVGNDLRNTASLLDTASNWAVNNNNAALAAAASYASSIAGSLAGMAAPSTYVSSAINYSANIGTVYGDRGIVDASSYALTGWNVGAIASGVTNVDLVTGAEVGDFFDRATMVSGGVAGTAGAVSGVIAVWSKASIQINPTKMEGYQPGGILPDGRIAGMGPGAALNNQAAREAAQALKFKPVKGAPFNSHGQPVFKKGNRYLTPDVDQHSGGVWKMFDQKGRRLGTYDGNLKRIGN